MKALRVPGSCPELKESKTALKEELWSVEFSFKSDWSPDFGMRAKGMSIILHSHLPEGESY